MEKISPVYRMRALDRISSKYPMNINTKPDMSLGLSETQAQEKIAKEGFNELPSSKPRNLLAIALGVVREPMFLLVACGTLYLVLGDVQEGVMLLGFVFLIMGIELYQEKKTEKALDALKDLASPRALVIRDGSEKRIAGREVVAGPWRWQGTNRIIRLT